MLLVRVDHEDGIRQLAEARDSAEVAVELVELAGVTERLTLGHTLEVTGPLHHPQFLEPLHAT